MKTSIFIFLLGFLTQNIFAQEIATDISNLSEKEINSFINVDSKNTWAKFLKENAQLSPLKKIALISFTTYSPYGEKNVFLPNIGTEYFANKLYSVCKNELINTFKENNIELITFESMTDEQKSLLSVTNKNKWLTNLGAAQEKYENAFENILEKSEKIGSSTQDYLNFTIEKDAPNQSELNVYSLLSKSLDVDAIILISNLITPGIDIYFNGTSITMIGSNPIIKNINEGMYYSRVDFSAEVEMATTKKDVLITEKYDGYNTLMKALVQTMVLDLKTKRKE